MAGVTLRRIGTEVDRDAARELRVAPEQQRLVASVEKSLADVEGDPALTAFVIYDESQRGLPRPDHVPVGFAVSEVVGSVGFILRLLIDEGRQHQGYGRAAMTEMVRRLRLNPDVELVATSHRSDNAVMARLCEMLGFVPWETPFEAPAGEVYLKLP